MAFKLTGTSLYKKVSTRGGSTMMKHKHEPSGALVRPLDHEHLPSGHTKPGSGTPKESTIMKHTGVHANSGHRPSDHSSHLIRRKSKVAKKKKASKS